MQQTSFTDKHLASLAAIMLLAPAVSFMLREKSIDIATEEESYVKSYIRYGYYILMTLGLALLVWGTYSLFFQIAVLYWVNYALLGAVIAMIIIGVFSIINNKTLVDRELHNDTESNSSTLLYYIPLYNYYLWYNNGTEDQNYRWVKESTLLWSLYLVIISIWPTGAAVFIGLLIIIARAIMVTVGMDILSINSKQKLNKRIYRNIEEIIAYPLGAITHIFHKGATLKNEIESWKLTYAQLDPTNHRRTIVSYIIAVGAIGYRGYTTRQTTGPSVGINLALLPQILWLGKICMTLPSGTLPRIPILYTLLGGRKEKTLVNETPTTNTQTTTKDITSIPPTI